MKLQLVQEQSFSSKVQAECELLADKSISMKHNIAELESDLSAATELRDSAQLQLQESAVQCNALRRQAEADEKALIVAEEAAKEATLKDATQSKLLEEVKQEVINTCMILIFTCFTSQVLVVIYHECALTCLTSVPLDWRRSRAWR